MTITRKHIKQPYNTIVLTVEYSSGNSSSKMIYEIDCLTITNGDWHDISEKDFDDPEIKEVIISHKHLWTDELKKSFKERYAKKLLYSTNTNTINKKLNETEIEDILNSLL